MSSSDQEPPPDESATPVAGNAALAQLHSQPNSLLCLYLNNRATTTTTRPRPPYRRSPSLNRKVRNIARGTARQTHSALGATTFADAAEVLLTTAPVGPLDKSTAAIHHLTVGPRASVCGLTDDGREARHQLAHARSPSIAEKGLGLDSTTVLQYYHDDRDGSILPPMARWNLNLSLPRQPRKPLCPPRPSRGSESTSHDAKTLSFISSSLPDFFQQAEDHTPHASWSRKSNSFAVVIHAIRGLALLAPPARLNDPSTDTQTQEQQVRQMRPSVRAHRPVRTVISSPSTLGIVRG
ncbi:hypothetical protein CPLU01_00418 [Colletotrichum plurivorum]|uniref:Uncharacterized protein n=1 Tax=Colletotrichum plurivorum TaxID=2175906 RepID=A0A8H6U6A6_9PEZI|nr:hypothetical protein CPLU01_00418 [Colletotrichum plurivorum]